MSIVLWGRRRLIALLLFWGHRPTAGTAPPNPGCAVFCPGGPGPACPEEGVCPLAYRCQWCWSGRLFGATLLVYDRDRTGMGAQEKRRGRAQTIFTGASEEIVAPSARGGIAPR